MRTLAAVGVLLALNAGTAVAQTFDAARLAAYCSETVAFAQAFGGGRVENAGSAVNAGGNRMKFDPRGEYAPFVDFEAGFSPTSKALHSVQASLNPAKAADAIAAFDAIAAALSAHGQFDRIELGEREVSASGVVGQKISFFTRPEADPPVGLRIDVRLWGRVSNPSTVSMECIEQAVERRAEGEAIRQ